MFPTVPGQPGKFKVGKVTETSIELTWEPAYTKEGIVNYELLYKPVKFGIMFCKANQPDTITDTRDVAMDITDHMTQACLVRGGAHRWPDAVPHA